MTKRIIKTGKTKKPRNLGLFLLLMTKSKRGGGHVKDKDKRVKNREIKEMKRELW